MKSRNQQGSAHLVIIIALVVVVLGALGVIFWQNFVNKSSTQEANTNTTEASVDTKKLTISEWGVQGEYTVNEDAPITYTISKVTEGDDIYEYATIDTPAIPEDCKGYGTVIWRYSPDSKIYHYVGGNLTTAMQAYADGDKTKENKVGDYYYFYSGPQSVCRFDTTSADSGASLSENVANTYVIDVTKELFKSLTAS